jgi:hypothetical protein
VSLNQLFICLSCEFVSLSHLCAFCAICLLPSVSLCQLCARVSANLSHFVSYVCLNFVSCLTSLCVSSCLLWCCQLSHQLSCELVVSYAYVVSYLSNLLPVSYLNKDGLGSDSGQVYLPAAGLILPTHPQLKARAWWGLTAGSGSPPQPPRGGGWGRHPLAKWGRPCPPSTIIF